MNLHVLQHVPFEGPGTIQNWALNNDCTISKTTFFENPTLPDPGEPDILIVMGGPMGVYDEDEHPWLSQEKKFIDHYLETGNPVLGICLGAQLLADAIGGNVYPADQNEIGWFPVKKTDAGKRSNLIGDWPERQTVLHWHGDTFSLPDDARTLLKSKACENQLFIHRNNLVGLQFHLEMTKIGIDELLNHTDGVPNNEDTVQSAEEIRQQVSRVESLQPRMDELLNQISQEWGN
jgi:GMP synthase-like glutamine amidotransferase